MVSPLEVACPVRRDERERTAARSRHHAYHGPSRLGGKAPEPTNALFSTSRDGSASVDVPGSLDGVRRVMVTDEPSGGSRSPTGNLLLTAST